MAVPILLTLALLQAAAASPPATPARAAPSAPAAATSAPSAAADASEAAAPTDPTVCRSVDVSGSAFPRKECHRLSTWTRMARDAS